jgi:hypothetical protein
MTYNMVAMNKTITLDYAAVEWAFQFFLYVVHWEKSFRTCSKLVADKGEYRHLVCGRKGTSEKGFH